VSQQLLSEAEDIWTKLASITDSCFAKKDAKDIAQQREEFWETPTDQVIHNKKAGLAYHLGHLEAFHKATGGKAGRFTATGHTVGECKLWAVLHVILAHVKDNSVLEPYPGLRSFYEAVMETSECQALLADGAQMPKAFGQYLVKA